MTNCLVITGGSRGIGRQTVTKFAKEGWKVINLSRKPCDMPNIVNLFVDLNEPQQIVKIANELQAHLQASEKICLVHSAAWYKRDAIDNIHMNDLQKTLTINVVSAIVLNQLVIPSMKAGSAIVYMGSTLSEKGVPGSASYTISKHAVVGMMRATTQDLANKGIISCCICPGLVETDMLRENIDEQSVANIIEQSVIGGRLIQPEEMADVIYFCSTNPLFNGSVLHANLGQQMS